MKKNYKRKSKMPYKYMVSLCLLSLLVIFVAIFVGYTYYNYKEESYEKGRREAQFTARRLVEQLDERMAYLQQYYASSMLEDDIKWMLENEVKYSDYSHYSEAAETMAGRKIFWDYIKGYALINFGTDIVLSNKGMFALEDAYNGDELYSVYNSVSDSLDKSFWIFREGEHIFKEELDAVDKNDRLTVEAEGLSLVMKLPLDDFEHNGMFIVNINMSTWQRWIMSWLTKYEDVVVFDTKGNIIYSTDELLNELCSDTDLEELLARNQGIQVKGTTYMLAMEQSNILGWKYCTFYNIDEGQKTAMRLSEIMLMLLIVLLVFCVYMISNIIYKPIKELMNDLSDEKQQVSGNELDYLANSFANLKNDKQCLETMVLQQQDKLQELFELRLIRGEVKSSEELEEYLQDLHLSRCKYFATAVMVLNLRGEDETNVNEDAICLNLVESLPEEMKQLTWMPLVYNACTMFCIFGNDDESELLNQVTKFYVAMQEYAQSTSGYRILMGVSATHTHYIHMRLAYRESVNALTMQLAEATPTQEREEEALLTEDGSVLQNMLDCHFYLANTSLRESNYNDSFEKDIRAAIKASDKEQCYKIVDEFSHILMQIEVQEKALVYILRFVNTILLTAMDAGVKLDNLYPDGLKKVYRELIEVIEHARVRRYIKMFFVDRILQARSELLEDSSYSMMEEIQRKIEETRGNITLTECAEALGVHQTYIWKVLKMEKGKSFSDYLEEYKLEEAKRLLLQSDMTVAEIATELNYTNAQNFIRFFSKSTGVTPGKFRKLY